jgi:steroid 5-alpha reductase family enzyme
MLHLILASAAAVFVYMAAVFVAALIKKDNSIVDIAWGPGFIVIALLCFFAEKAYQARPILVTGLVIIWAARLAGHIYLRNRGRGEDYRYARWRKDWGKWFILRSFFQVFMLQGLFLLLISYPIMLINYENAKGLSPLDAAGVLVWLGGFFFEVVGDEQLRRFKQREENKGRIMTTGLWRTTRHPNYFGEAAQWWGIFLLALPLPRGWTAVISPLVITFLLLKVSGVTMLEKKYAGNKEFADYAGRTNAFFPWFAKKPRGG